MLDHDAPSIAFVGAGPTTIYTLCAFLDDVTPPAAVTIYEEQPRAGLGTPYRPGWNDPAMLSNIASVEIPRIEAKLIDWLNAQPRARLIRLGIDPDAIDERAFYPRLALGEYFLDQFNGLIARARSMGVTVEVAASCKITDIRADQDVFRLAVSAQEGEPIERVHDYVVLATGHEWPEEPEVRPGFFACPWPATALYRIPATDVGIRGSSLTAIDAAVAVAGAHGTLVEFVDRSVVYRPNPGSERLRLTMLSRKGLLPEADFYHPIPYEPLRICTPEAMAKLIEQRCPTLVDAAYSLFKDELMQADPAYAARIGLENLSLDDFADAYFAERLAADVFEWAKANLAEARANFEDKRTIAWRYAILRMHEVVAQIVPHLSEDALDRFNRAWKPIFVDDYATVPHLSIERLLALHRAGRLEVLALGEGHRINTHGSEPGATVLIDGERRHFPAFIDATGQRPLAIDVFPFESLRKQGVVQDVAETPDEGDDGSRQRPRAKGVAVDDLFHPVSDHSASQRLFCLSIPFILGRHPFIQGITSSYEMGSIVGKELAHAIADNAAPTEADCIAEAAE